MSDAKIVITEKVTITETAEMFVNGRSVGAREINGHPTLLEVAKELASEHNIKTFEVSYNGSILPKSKAAEAAKTPVQTGDKVGVFAKDSRGARKMSGTTTEPGTDETLNEPTSDSTGTTETLNPLDQTTEECTEETC